MRVGELARRTGVSVRALHHYDEIGLLAPARRSPAGHRLYGEGDVSRLLRIRALQQLGFSLDEVRACLADPAFTPLHVVDLHLAALRERMDAERRLCTRLERLRDRLGRDGEASLGEFLEAIEEITMFEKYYTKDQLDELAKRRQELGEDRLRAAEQEWAELIAAVRTEHGRGTPPDDPAVQELARRWSALVQEFTGGDAGIRRSLAAMYRDEPSASARFGLDPALMAYVAEAAQRAE